MFVSVCVFVSVRVCLCVRVRICSGSFVFVSVCAGVSVCVSVFRACVRVRNCDRCVYIRFFFGSRMCELLGGSLRVFRAPTSGASL